MGLEDFSNYDSDSEDGDEDEPVAAEGESAAADADSSPDETGGSRAPGESATGSPDSSIGNADSPPQSEDIATEDTATEETDDPFVRPDTSPPVSPDALGSIAASRGLKIDAAGEDTSLQAYVTTGNRETVRVGSYVLVPYPDGEMLFCSIAALEYAQEFHTDDATEVAARRALAEDEFDEADYKFIADLDPIAILYGSGEGLDRRLVDRVPKPQSAMREAGDKSEIKTGLSIPESGLFLGYLAVSGERIHTAAEPPTIDYRLEDSYDDGDPLLFRHVLVAGGTGSGKTHAAKNVLRQVLDEDRTYPLPDGREQRPAMVIFDPQDEYAQMHEDTSELSDGDRRRLEQEGIAYGGHEDTVAFVPQVGGATYQGGSHRAEQIPFTISFSMVQDNEWLVAGAGLNDHQYQGLGHLLDRFFTQYGDSGTYAEFRSFLDDPALREELDESGRVHEKTFDAIVRRIQGFGRVFDQDAVPITEQVNKFVRPGRNAVVPTYHISDSRAAETVVLAVATLLVDQKLSSDPTYERIKETPLVLGMDEAHNYLADAESVQARRVIGKFTDAAKQGRKERLGLFLITQDPQDIHDAIFKQINTTVVLNLGDEDAIDSVNIPTELEHKVPYMQQGGMVVYSPDNSEPVELDGLSTCLTRHGD